jgi:hypothetical protein
MASAIILITLSFPLLWFALRPAVVVRDAVEQISRGIEPKSQDAASTSRLSDLSQRSDASPAKIAPGLLRVQVWDGSELAVDAKILLSSFPDIPRWYRRDNQRFVRSFLGPRAYEPYCDLCTNIVATTDTRGEAYIRAPGHGGAVMARSNREGAAGVSFTRWPEAPGPIVLRLKAKRSVVFTFVDAASGASVVARGACYQKVAAYPVLEEAERYRKVEEFEGVESQCVALYDGDTVSIEVEADGYESCVYDHVMSPAEPTRLVKLTPYTGIRGHILDSVGNPIRGALILATPRHRGGCIVHTRADGGFQVAPFAGSTTILASCSPLYEQAKVEVADGSSGTVDIRLKFASVRCIRGRLLTAEGMPAVGARVQLWREGASDLGPKFSPRLGDPFSSTLASVDGQFDFPSVAFGTYSVDAFAPEPARSSARSEVVPVRHHLLSGIVVSQETVPPYLEVRLAAIGEIEVSISEDRLGSLVDKMPQESLPSVILEPLDDRGVRQFRVGSLELFAGRRGCFIGVPIGSYSLRSYPPAMAWRVDVQSDRTTSIEVGSSSDVLRCVVRRDGLPVSGCRVCVVADDGPMVVLRVTDTEGAFSLPAEFAGVNLVCRLQDRSQAIAFARIFAESGSRLRVDWPSSRLGVHLAHEYPASLFLRVYVEHSLGLHISSLLGPAMTMVASKSLEDRSPLVMDGLAEGQYRVQLEDSEGRVVASATAFVDGARGGLVTL